MKTKVADIVTQLIPFIFAGLLAAIGGVIQYLHKIDKHGLPFKTFNFFLEIFTSAFVGIIAFMLCDYAGWDWQLTAAIVAISGHMGARALFIIEKLIVIPFLRRYGYDDSEGTTQEEKETINAKKRQD